MKHKRKFNKLGNVILTILNELTVGTFKSFFPHPYYHTFCSHTKPNSLSPALLRLEKKGLIKKYKYKGERQYILTEEGKKKSKTIAFLMKMADLFIGPKKSSWDGKWRMIFFDIPEKLRKYRDELRMNLKMLGFCQLQKSVWIHPLPIPREFFEEFIKQSLRPYIRIAVIDDIDQEDKLRKFFFDN